MSASVHAGIRPHGCGPGDPPPRVGLGTPHGCGPGEPPWPDPPTSPLGVGLETPQPDPQHPPGCGPGDPPARPLNIPPGCGPGDPPPVNRMTGRQV